MSEIESVRHEGYCYLDINRMAARSPHFNGSTGPLLTITPEGELQFGEGVGPKEAAAAIAEAFKEELAGIVKAAAAEQSTRDAAIFDELRALCAPGAEALPDGVRLTRIIQVLDPLLAPERAARMPNAVEAAIPSVPAFAAYHPGVGIVPETCVATAAQVMHHMGSLYRDGDEISADGWPRAAAAGWRVEPVVIAPGSTDTDPAAARLTEEAEAFLRRRAAVEGKPSSQTPEEPRP
ncbi:hypothetical protein BN1110_06333 [bacterium YEK0313]|nr:hypothetical protein BN1110_06333 [bacterium YEK0313]